MLAGDGIGDTRSDGGAGVRDRGAHRKLFGGTGSGAAVGLAVEGHAGFVAMAGEIEAGVNDYSQNYQDKDNADENGLFHRPTTAVSVKNEPILRNLW